MNYQGHVLAGLVFTVDKLEELLTRQGDVTYTRLGTSVPTPEELDSALIDQEILDLLRDFRSGSRFLTVDITDNCPFLKDVEANLAILDGEEIPPSDLRDGAVYVWDLQEQLNAVLVEMFPLRRMMKAFDADGHLTQDMNDLLLLCLLDRAPTRNRLERLRGGLQQELATIAWEYRRASRSHRRSLSLGGKDSRAFSRRRDLRPDAHRRDAETTLKEAAGIRQMGGRVDTYRFLLTQLDRRIDHWERATSVVDDILQAQELLQPVYLQIGVAAIAQPGNEPYTHHAQIFTDDPAAYGEVVAYNDRWGVDLNHPFGGTRRFLTQDLEYQSAHQASIRAVGESLTLTLATPPSAGA